MAAAADQLVERSEAVELSLALTDAQCAARTLTDDEATALDGDALTVEIARAVAERIIECAGAQEIARSALSLFTAGASARSIACAGERVDRSLLVELVADQLAEEKVSPVEVELAVVTAVSLCLEPEELRGRG